MENCAILFGSGQVVRTSKFSTVQYDYDGFLISFSILNDGKESFFLFFRKDELLSKSNNENEYIKEGFYNLDDYRKYLQNEIYWYEMERFSKEKFEHSQKNDLVVLEKLSMTYPYNKIQFKTYTWDCPDDNMSYSFNKEIQIPANAQISEAEHDLNTFNPNAKLFFTNKISTYVSVNTLGFTDSQKNEIANCIAKATISINIINKRYFDVYFTDPELTSIKNSFNTEWTTSTIPTNNGIIPFLEYYHNISAFSYQIRLNINILKDYSGYKKFYELAKHLSVRALTTLAPQIKTNLLLCAAADLSSYKEVEFVEQLCVRIAASFDSTNLTTIDSFLEFLVAPQQYQKDEGLDVTLYEFIYKRLSTSFNFTEGIIGVINWVFDTNYKPTNTKGAFVMALYAIWQSSKFCPYEFDGTLKPNTLGFRLSSSDNVSFTNESDFDNFLFKYTFNTGYSIEEYDPNIDPQLYNDGALNYKVTDEHAAPIVIPYESVKSIGIFCDNFNFYFEGAKISAYESKIFSPNELDTELPLNMGYEIIDYGRVVFYGEYDIFQPVTLANVDINTKVPFYSTTGTNINAFGKDINSFIPVFVLKFIDDAGDRSDTEQIVGYAVDIVLTASMVGNVSKIRHLRWIALAADDIGLLTFKGLSLVLDSVTFSSEVLRCILQFIECDANNEFCKGWKTFSHIFSVACLSINGTVMLAGATLSLKNQAQKLIDIAANGISDEAIIRLKLEEEVFKLYPTESNVIIVKIANAIFQFSRRTAAMSNLLGFPSQGILVSYRLIKFTKIKAQRFLYKSSYKRFNDFFDALEWTTNPPRFSINKYESRIRDGFTEYKAVYTTKTINGIEKKVFQELHTRTEFSEMFNYGINQKGFTKDVVIDIILKSYRVAKQKTKLEILEIMDGYHDYINIRNKLPYCFESITHEELFFDELKILFEKYELLSDMDNVFIAGSALYQKIPAGQLYKYPPDLDLVNSLSETVILKKLDEYKKMVIDSHRCGILKSDRYYEYLENWNSCYVDKRITKDVIVRVNETFINDGTGGIMTRLDFFVEDLRIISKKSNRKPLFADPTKNNLIDFNIFNKAETDRRLFPEKKINLQ